MIDSTGPEESTFATAHRGDRIEIAVCTPLTCNHPRGECPRGWMPPVRLVTEPEPCPDGRCGAHYCTGVDPEGHTIPIHAALTRPTRVLEHGPTRRSA